MKRFAEQLKKRSESVRLRAVERGELRDRLVTYMEYHPLPESAGVAKKQGNASIRGEQFFAIRFSSPQVRGFISAFVVLVLIIIPIAAERSLPGDVLYPVKVNVTEEIRSSLAVSPYAKVEWETRRLERRIAEARLLASEGRLTQEVGSEVAEAVKAHTNAAQQGIAELRKSDSDEAAIAEITFESALTVQSEVLEVALKRETEAGASSTAPGHSVAALVGAVEEARKDATASQSGIPPSYEKLVARMETETTRAYELFESIKEVASEEEEANIERRLDDIRRKVEAAALQNEENDADELVAASSTPDVHTEIGLLRTALSDLQKLISFMTDIDVRENVTIEKLIPITLTTEERLSALTQMQNEVEEAIVRISEAYEEYADDERTEKLALGLIELEARASTSKAALESEDLDVAQDELTEAIVLVRDINALLDILDLPATSTDETSTTSSSTASTTENNASTTETMTEEGAVEGTSTPTTTDETGEPEETE